MSTEELNYHDRKHAEQTERINASMQHEAQRKAAEAEANIEPTPAVEIPQEPPAAPTPDQILTARYLEDQKKLRERMAREKAQRDHDAARAADGDLVREQQRQAREENMRRWQERDAEPDPKSEQWHADLNAEIERQVARLSASFPPNSPEVIREQAIEVARSVLISRAQPAETLESEVARLTRQVAAIDDFLRGVTKRYSSAA